jgi:nucleoside-diphosphate-sugar epimerase
MAAAGDVIGRIRGRRFVFDSDAYRKLLGSACYDSSRIERELGFEPVHNLRDGVAEMAVDLRRSDGGGLGASVV